MTVSQPSQDPNKDAATAAWELQVTQTANQIQHQIDNIQADCLLLAKGQVDSEFFSNIKDFEDNNYDYSGFNHDKT